MSADVSGPALDTASAVAPASAASPPPVERVTLLRVKRKRDESPVEALILAGSTDSSPPKRSALDDLRLQLERASLIQSAPQPPLRNAVPIGSESGTVRKVFKLVGTTSSASDALDDALLSRIAALQERRRAKAVHPSVPQSSTAEAATDRRVEQQQQRAAGARERRVMHARLQHVPVSSAVPSPPSPFAVLDVSINRPSVPLPSPSVSLALPLPSTQRRAAALSAAPPPASDEQERKDALFSRAMSIVKAMPDTDRMAAYSSLLDDYWDVTAPTPDAPQPPLTFTQRVQQRSAMDLSAPPTREAGPLVPIDVVSAMRPRGLGKAEDEWVYDVYHVVEEGAAAAEEEAEAGRVVIDSKVAGWFGLVADDEEAGADSDEDVEDENREGWEGNDYPEDEDDDGEDDGTEGAEDEGMDGARRADADEEFWQLRRELRRTTRPLIPQSDGEDDEDWREEDSDDEDEEDEYGAAPRAYRAQYDAHI